MIEARGEAERGGIQSQSSRQRDRSRSEILTLLAHELPGTGPDARADLIAFARDVFKAPTSPGCWLKCDDSSVTPVSPDHVKTSAAYVLFYARRPRRAEP